MTKDLATQNRKQVSDLLKTQKAQIEAALPKHMTPDRLARIVLTEMSKTPELAECTPTSFLGAVIQTAQLGLEPGGALGHSYFIPFNNRKQGTKEVQFIVGYRGMIDLARRSGQVTSLQAHCIHEEDVFDFEYGLDEKLRHVPARGDRGEMVGAYAIAKLKDGGHQIEVMWKSEIDEIKKQSKASNFGPWVTHYDEMAKKTVIRRLFKYLPVSIEMQTAVALDERPEKGIPQDCGDFLTIDPQTGEIVDEKGKDEPKSKTEGLKGKLSEAEQMEAPL